MSQQTEERRVQSLSKSDHKSLRQAHEEHRSRMSRRQEELNHSNELDRLNHLTAGLTDNPTSGVASIAVWPDAPPDDPRLLDFVQVETRDEGTLFVQRSLLKARNLELGGIIPGLETRTLFSHEEWDQCCGRSKT
jgi:hypothetical protein